jgi:hypothetical protein
MASPVKFVSLILISLFFIVFGVLLLISAYGMSNPFEFIITFFAANFIILISAALCLGFVLRLIRLFKPAGDDRPKGPDSGS